jgi:hypothetical protein
VNRPLSGKSQGTTAIIHQTVRCASCAPGQRLATHQRAPRVPNQRSPGYTGLSGVSWDQRLAMVGFAKQGRESRIVHCLVRPQTKSYQSLPNGAPMAPRPLGYKRDPRHMEHYTKHPLNILRHQDTAITLEL